MKDFLKKVIEGIGITPSEVCAKSFNENFSNAINVEWFGQGGYYEVIFYIDNLEHIAIFSLKGVLMEYSQNMPTEYLPDPIKIFALSKGEIMNVVLKNKGNMIEYELIIRDNLLERRLIVLSNMGEVKEEIAL